MRLGFKIYKNKKSMGSKGAVYVEFLVVIIPLFIFFLGLTQLGLMYTSSILVKLAANKAARAAIVILPDDLTGIDYKTPVNFLAEEGEGLEAYAQAPDNGRYDAIRNAARIIMSPVSPGIRKIVDSALSGSHTPHSVPTPALNLGGGSGIFGGILSSLEGYLYTSAGVAVAFVDTSIEDATDAARYKSSFGSREKITSEVHYLFMCRIPIVKTMMCTSYQNLPEYKRQLFAVRADEFSSHVLSALENPLADYLVSPRFIVLTAHTTLTNQGRK